MSNLQPVDGFVMGAVKDELINHTVNPNGPADELKFRIVRVTEDEMIRVKAGQLALADSAGQRGDVVDIWLLDHGAHCVFHGSVIKLEASVLLPNGFNVKPWSIELFLQKPQ